MKAIVVAVLAGLCWGIGEVFTKSVLHTRQIGPLTAITVRSTVAIPVMWAVWAIAMYGLRAEPRGWMRADAPTLLKLVLGSGLCAGAAGMILFYTSLHLGPVSRVKPVAFSVAPATAVVIAWVVLGESMTITKGIALVLILLGVVLLTLE